MRTAIDVGNTNVKIGWFAGTQPEETLVFPSQPFSGWYTILADRALGECILSTVVPLPEHIRHYLAMKAQKLHVLGTDSRLPFISRYRTPQSLGNDRIALAAAAVAGYPEQDTLVISAGTCITYNFITAAGEFLGGAISPGLRMRIQAMHDHTAALPLVTPEGDKPVLGYDTETSLRSGGLNGMIFEMQGYINFLQKEYNSLTVVISGGDSQLVGENLKYPAEVRPDLVLDGLCKILELNAQN